ncbi:MAG TPA: XdhC family protein [Bacillota bacterium]|jgi:xanthine dehydrogenase accessory factor|nr:XdhC family protein [Bacillota bacterium]HQB80566.1 XdhC family protein [Bacillota bacterium]
MDSVLKALESALEDKQDTVLATVTASSGATPRGEGARMLVGPTGRLAGTVGGGAVELHSLSIAQEAIRDRRSDIHHFFLTKNQIEDIGMICGGNATVHYLFLKGSDQELLRIVKAARQAIKRRQPSWLLTDISEKGPLGLALFTAPEGANPADPDFSMKGCQFTGFPEEDACTRALLAEPHLLCQRGRTFELCGHRFYVEELVVPGVVYIFGGGHVGQALAPVLSKVHFAVVVLDDREEFTDPALFPGAYDVRLCDLKDIGQSVTIGPEDYVCIMTRGHSNDLDVEDQVLATPARYIGVIGSRHKTQTIDRLLMERGHTKEALERAVTPIGLDIGGETPEEIAISIAAQMIAVRAGKLEARRKL